MKKISRILLNIVLLPFLLVFAGSKPISTMGTNDQIRINSLGYTPDGSKIVTVVASSCEQVVVKNSKNNKVVIEAEVSGPYYQIDDKLVFWKSDFSALKKSGTYYLEVRGVGRSIDFTIDASVYNFPYQTAMRAFYLWRCGTEVHGTFEKNTFEHEACHMNDGYNDYNDIEQNHSDGTGGWHDAGDYGKYVTNAGITVGNLLLAWDHFESKLQSISLDLPQTAPEMPEFLQELKWETDYLLKMEYPDGSGKVHHKLTRTNFSGFIMPEEDDAKRYFTSWGTNAVANFAATMAMAARAYKPYNAKYAQTLLDAAQRTYAFLKNNPEYKRWEQKEFKTGGYQTHDRYARLWAAAEMWETTGEKTYLQDFENQVQKFGTKVDLNWDWGNVKNLGIFTYVLSDKPGRDEKVHNEIKSALIENANIIVENTKTDVFGRPFDRYYWGCNGTVARLAINLGVANRVKPDAEYTKAAEAIIAHLFGRNYYGRSYVTGLGIDPPMNAHSRRSGADDVKEPWPGYLVGGGHSATDWVDEESSYSHNEIAINWQAPLVYVLAWFTEENK